MCRADSYIMSRPRISDQTVVISANGLAAIWDVEVGFVGDDPLVARARSAARWAMEVRVHPLLSPVIAGDEDPVSAYAALSWAAGGRDVIVAAPADVHALFAAITTTEADEDITPDGQLEFEPEFVSVGE